MQRICRLFQHALVSVGSVIFLVSCGSGGKVDPIVIGPPVTMAGKVTFDRVLHDASTSGLDYNNIVAMPVRGVEVELLDGGTGALLASTVTDEMGDYSFDTNADENIRLRVRAHLVDVLGEVVNTQVRDNTTNNALYVLETAPFDVVANQAEDLHAASGWTGSAYTQVRAAAPFAILDDAHEAYAAILTANSNYDIPELDVFWSPNNRPVSGDLTLGEISTSFFRRLNTGERQVYILGAANSDTDEYDRHVTIHELGHFIESAFSRTDSVGGPHSFGDFLDPRVAYSEGWGYAFAAMVLDDPLVIDSGGLDQGSGFSFNVESNTNLNEGWFSEGSVQSIIYDLYDAENEAGDAVSAGFGPVFEAMVAVNEPNGAFGTIFSYLDGFIAGNGMTAAVNDLMDGQSILALPGDEFGDTETNDGGNPFDVLPIHTNLALNATPVTLCSTASNSPNAVGFGFFNKLSVSRLVRFTIATGGTYRLFVDGANGSDPDMAFFRGNSITAFQDIGEDETAILTLAPGAYRADIYEYENLFSNPFGRSCFNVSLSDF